MAQRLPSAVLFTGKYTDSQLIARAQQVHDLMDENDGTFTAPPVTMADLQTDIGTYTQAAADAIKGSKSETALKLQYKKQLELDLKQLQLYVNQVAQNNSLGTPQSDLQIVTIINMSGFKVSKLPTPVNAITGHPLVKVRRAISQDPGTLKILIRQYTNENRNTILYQVQYRTSAILGTPSTPAGPWLTQTFTGQNQILLTGLTSGLSYDYQVAAIGGRDIKRNQNPPVNYTPIESVIII